MERELIDIKTNFAFAYNDLIKFKDTITECKFSKGGTVFFRGLFTPFLSFKYGLYNNSRGRMTNSERNFTFKYCFNDNDLVYVIRNLDDIKTEEFIFKYENEEIGLTFDQREKQLTDITLCKYENDQLISVCNAHIMKWMDSCSFSFTTEYYNYQGNTLKSMEEVTGDTKYTTRYHSLYEFNGNEFKIIKQWITK